MRGIERTKRLALLNEAAQLRVHAYAGMRIDRLAGALAARTEPLYCPADGGAVHGGDVAGLRSEKVAGGAWCMKGTREDARVTPLRGNHALEAGERRATCDQPLGLGIASLGV